MKPLNIVHVSSFPPTACGVAEYTAALSNAIRGNASSALELFVRLNCDASKLIQDERAIVINPSDRKAIQAAAAIVNRLERKLVLLQHEFKL